MGRLDGCREKEGEGRKEERGEGKFRVGSNASSADTSMSSVVSRLRLLFLVSCVLQIGSGVGLKTVRRGPADV